MAVRACRAYRGCGGEREGGMDLCGGQGEGLQSERQQQRHQLHYPEVFLIARHHRSNLLE
jgi:hypothetical protein